MLLHLDRFFPLENNALSIAKDIYEKISGLPIISPHGHTDPRWFAENTPFSNPSALFLTPDHYVLRMLNSRGICYDNLGVPYKDGHIIGSPEDAWKLFAKNYHLFWGTPSRIWIDHSLESLFNISEPLHEHNAEEIYNKISHYLKKPEFLPRSILMRLNVEILATTEYALDPLISHKKIAEDGLTSKVITTYRPDDVTDPDYPNSQTNFLELGEITKEDITNWNGLINAHRKRREIFRNFGATATDHAAPSALTADLSTIEKQALLDKILKGSYSNKDAELFRAQMLTEMALLSIEDGMTMQMHIGSNRNMDPQLFLTRGGNLGADIPIRVDWAKGMQPLLARCGNEKKLKIIVFSLDESAYSRELAPMAGYWSSLLIGPPWWFHDSSQGIRRYFDQVVETAGFFNLAGFNDDTRALLSIPSRHDLWRREVSRFLAVSVSEHRISKSAAEEIGAFLAYQAAKNAYNLN